MLVADAEELLRGQAQGLFPCSLPERAIPGGRSRDPVAHVLVIHGRNAGQRRLTHLPQWWARLLSLAHFLDGQPGTLAVSRPLTGPGPAAILEHPAFADQGNGEAV